MSPAPKHPARIVLWLLAGLIPGCGGPPATVERSPKVAETKPAQRTAPARPTPRRAGSKEVAKVLPNGLRILFTSAPPGELAHLVLAVDAGSARDPVGKPGLARLSARSLRESAAGQFPGGGLELALDTIDAYLELRVDASRTRLVASCPAKKLGDLARILFHLVTLPAPGREDVEREANALARELVAGHSERIREWQVLRSLGTDAAPPAEVSASLAQLGAVEVELFLSLHYRPAGSELVVQTPGIDAALVESIMRVFEPWKAGADLGPIREGEEIAPMSFARTSDGNVEVLFLLPSPAPEERGSATAEALWQLFCMDGTGGLVGAELATRGIRRVPASTETFELSGGRARALVLRPTASEAPDCVEALVEATRRLGNLPPDEADLSLARRRALLAWDVTMARPATRTDALSRAAASKHALGLDKRVIESVQTLRAADVPTLALRTFTPAILVRGPEAIRPKDARILPDVREPRTAVGTRTRIRDIEIQGEERTKLVEAIVARARRALGGEPQLADLKRIVYRARCLRVAALPFRETWTLVLPDGPFGRERNLLGTTIRTNVAADAGVERSPLGDRKLEDGERESFRAAARAHPIALFAGKALERAAVKLLGRTRPRDRNLLVLSVTEEGRESLQVAIDEANGLPRSITYREWMPERPAKRVRLALRDYRQRGQLRLPHTAYVFVDDEYRGERRFTYPGVK